jgi:hypothetical protein
MFLSSTTAALVPGGGPPWCAGGSGAVVLADRVAYAAERLDGWQVPEGQSADRADQRQQFGDAVAAGFGWWKGVVTVASYAVEVPAGGCVVAPGPLWPSVCR